MLLGLAFQAGRIPFSLKNLHDSFKKSLPKNEIENNWRAFILGRKIFLEREEGLKGERKKEEQNNFYSESIKESLWPWDNKLEILSYFEKTTTRLKELFLKSMGLI